MEPSNIESELDQLLESLDSDAEDESLERLLKYDPEASSKQMVVLFRM